MARRLEALLAKNFPYLVAEQAGVVAGYAYVAPYHARPAYRWSVEDSVYVAPEFQRRGIGPAPPGAADRRRRGARFPPDDRGRRRLRRTPPSIALHAAAGFRRIGAVQSVGFKHGRWLDTVLMQRPLGRGDSSAP